MTVPPRPLEYAQQIPWHRRRHVGQWVLCVCALSLAGVGWQWAPRIWQQVTILLIQRECLNYEASSQQVIYSQNEKTSAIPQPWGAFHRVAHLNLLSLGSAYMHQRRRPDGEERLVFVDIVELTSSYMGPSAPAPKPVACFSVHVFRPATLFRQPIEVTNLVVSQGVPTSFNASLMKVLAGQSDPANPSHFTICCESAGGASVIDGYLHNDDSVTLEARRPESGGH